MKIEVQRIVGYCDIFGQPKMFYKLVLGRRIGRKRILQLSALMLTYCRKGVKPVLRELIEMFFIYKDNFDKNGYNEVAKGLESLAIKEGGAAFAILSEEALLNLYTWAANETRIKEEGNGLEDQNSPDLLKLILLFNDDVLARFAKAKRTTEKYKDRRFLRMIFAQRFPQNDIVEIDYGKLIFTQAYKLMKLLNFLESTPKYRAVYEYLLNDFNVRSKEEFFKAIGGAVLSPLNLNKSGINTIVIENNPQSETNIAFLDKLAHSYGEAEQGSTDYRFLRDRPLQKVENEYRIIFDFFLIKKLYNGLVFKLSAYVNENGTLFNGPLFGSIRDEFTESVLLYDTMEAVLSKTKTITITGNYFKTVKVQREPDYYCRFDKQVILVESKDFFMTAEEKLSYDFNTMMTGLAKDGRLKKACLQCATNVGRLLLRNLPLDPGYDPSMTIYPVIVLHDSLYDVPSLNYWVNEWFQDELAKLKANAVFIDSDFSLVKHLTLVDIDTLILYRTNFENGEMSLFEMLRDYQDYVDFKSCTEENYNHGIIPLASFADEYAGKKGIKVDLILLKETYDFSGFKD
jgi:hypothetical protein